MNLYPILAPAIKAMSHAERASRLLQLTCWLNEALLCLPKAEREALLRFWSSKQVVLKGGIVKPAPYLTLEAWSCSPGAESGIYPLAATLEGTSFEFDVSLLFAPREVVMTVMVHELAHASVQAREIKLEGLPNRPIGDLIEDSYLPEDQQEEQAVSDMVASWGFDQEGVHLWQAALCDHGLEWRPAYDKAIAERTRRRHQRPTQI